MVRVHSHLKLGREEVKITHKLHLCARLLADLLHQQLLVVRNFLCFVALLERPGYGNPVKCVV